MTTGPKSEQTTPARPKEAVEDAVRSRVLQLLGRPSDHYEVRVCRLWGDRYRINVFVGPDRGTARIEHSFFLVSDASGNIVSTFPKLKRHYQVGEHSGAAGEG